VKYARGVVKVARIILIDDDELFRNSMRRVLERAHHEVTLAANGTEGVRLHREQPADVIVTDILMPEKEGIETIMELRRGDPELKIIAMSGAPGLERSTYLRAAGLLGAARTLAKPFAPQELLDAVDGLLRQPGPA
jgi:DNA-binding response OmpR family regulator